MTSNINSIIDTEDKGQAIPLVLFQGKCKLKLKKLKFLIIK